MNLPIMECSLVPIRYRSSPSISGDHGLHLSEAHNTVYDVAVDHERRYAVGKSSVDHEISCIRKDGRVEACNVAHQIIELSFPATSLAASRSIPSKDSIMSV